MVSDIWPCLTCVLTYIDSLIDSAISYDENGFQQQSEEEMFMASLICNLDVDCEKLLVCKSDLDCIKTLHFDTEVKLEFRPSVGSKTTYSIFLLL